MKAILIFAFSLCSLFVTAQKVYKDAVLTYSNDMPVYSYTTDKVELIVTPDIDNRIYGFGKELRLYIRVKNKSETPINIGPELVKVSVAKGNGSSDLYVYTANEYLNSIQKNILLFGPDNKEKVSVTTTATAKDETGMKIGEFQASTSTYVYTGALDEAYSSTKEFVSAKYLKRNTLFNGQEAKGFVAAKITKKTKNKPIEIKVELGGDIYIFNF